jgi:release factor glutamine methyltransferase
MKSRRSLVAEAAATLSASGFLEPRRHARLLVASALAISQADLFGFPDRMVGDREVSRFRMMLDRFVEREPLSRILGRREFWGLELGLSADTFDPRPETETIIEAVLRRQPDRNAPLRVLDLGTGTGCLLLALLRELPRASGIGVDIVEAAVITAFSNAATLGFAERAFFAVGDWGAAVGGRFDAIVANPPYIATKKLQLLPLEVARYDPWRALDGGRDGLDAHRAIAADVAEVLAPGGIFATEVGHGQADLVTEIIAASGLTIEGIESDLAGVRRCVIAKQAIRDRKTKKGLEYSPVPSRVRGWGSGTVAASRSRRYSLEPLDRGQGMPPMD